MVVTMEGRQSWRVVPVCKTGAERLSEFESHPLHQSLLSSMAEQLTLNQQVTSSTLVEGT